MSSPFEGIFRDEGSEPLSGNSNSGRPPKPTALKVLEGNPGQRPIKEEPKPRSGAPKPPADLTGEALAEWGRIVPDLDRIHMLAKVDRAYLVVYCRAWGTYCSAVQALEELGPIIPGREGTLVKNPAAQLMRDAADLMLKYGSRFGLSPSDRVKLAVTPADDDDAEGEEKAALQLLS